MLVQSNRKFVVDCEYSGETHQIISVAIVPLWYDHYIKPSTILELPEREFYEVISPLPQGMSDWVKTNVVPHLNKPGISLQQFQEKLEAFFTQHQIEELHYDWCDDIAYINRLLITGPGERIALGGRFLSHIHHPDIEYRSKTAHNALEDARAVAAAIRERIFEMA